jgi:tRNA (guanine37-N1)-methyltransferase
MVMKPEPVFEAVESVLGLDAYQSAPQPVSSPKAVSPRRARGPNGGAAPIIMLTPQGRVFSQSIAEELFRYERIALLCGRYEGIDERIREHLATDEISIGDYVLTGGELPAMIVIDAVSRLIPGVLGDPDGATDDSHASGLLEYPHYTRPPEFRGWKVPEILLSGDHAKLAKWRREQSLLRTLERRPDLLQKAELSEEDRKFLETVKHSH